MSKQSSTGQKVARATSAAVNIARGAAAGGVYGAAFEAAKSFLPELLKLFVILLFIVILVPMLIFTAIPNILFGYGCSTRKRQRCLKTRLSGCSTRKNTALGGPYCHRPMYAPGCGIWTAPPSRLWSENCIKIRGPSRTRPPIPWRSFLMRSVRHKAIFCLTPISTA